MRITKPYLARFARKFEDGTDDSVAPGSSSQNASSTRRPSHGTTFTKVRSETSDDQ